MDTLANVTTTNFAPAQPADPAHGSEIFMSSALLAGVVAFGILAAISARTSSSKPDVRMWGARALLTAIVAVVLSLQMWQYPYNWYDGRLPWLGEIGLVTVSYGVVLAFEWAVGLFRRSA